MKCIYHDCRITLTNGNNTYSCDHITNIDEYDHEIIFETGIPIDEIDRGWIGDLFYHIKGFPIDKCDGSTVTSVTCFKDVLLARITITACPDEVVMWKYTFLKD